MCRRQPGNGFPGRRREPLPKKSFCGKTTQKVFAFATGEAACPPMTEPGTARGSQGFAFLKIRKGDAAARWVAASRETLSRDFPMRREAAFVQAAAGKRVLRKNDIRSFRVRIRRTRAAIFQKATLATAAGGGRREQGLAPRSATGEAACPPMTEPGTARGSQGFAFLKIRKGDAAARWVAASRETLSRDFPMRREAAFVQAAVGKRVCGSFCVRVRRTRAVLFQKAAGARTVTSARFRLSGNGFPGRRRKPLPKKSFCGKTTQKVFAFATGEAACPPMTEPGTARGSQGFAFIKIRKGDAAARWAAASRETLSRGFPMRREAAFVQAAVGKRFCGSFRVRVR